MGYADITATLGGITLNQTGRAIECVVLLMLFYLVISLGISMVMNVAPSEEAFATWPIGAAIRRLSALQPAAWE